MPSFWGKFVLLTFGGKKMKMSLIEVITIVWIVIYCAVFLSIIGFLGWVVVKVMCHFGII
jgi:hypothetical protein